MINRIRVESENPDTHWNHLKVDGENVLDLGCGRHLAEDGWLTTPEFFLAKGARRLEGVDSCEEDIAWYKENMDKDICTFHADHIDSSHQIEAYIEGSAATALKMDIEWNEKFFIQSSCDFPTLKYVAVETHSRELFHDMMFKLLDLGFDITHIGTFYPRVFDICNMIYAERV